MMKEELITKHKKKRGQSIVEILVAITVITITIYAIMVLVFSNQASITDAKNRNIALQMAKNNLEDKRADAKDDFASLQSSSETEGEFSKDIIVENITPYEKRVISRVSWPVGASSRALEIATAITNAKELLKVGGDDGGEGLSGDWQNPQTLGSINLGPGNSATGLDVRNKIVYMSASAAAADKPDFFIIDATDGENPFITASLNTGPTLNGIDVANNYAYVANDDPDAQLQIIDVSDINSPFVVSSFKLPGTTEKDAVGKGIFFYDSKIYMGTPELSEEDEFYIIDVSNAESPQFLGSKKIGGDVNSIRIANNIAYITTSIDDGEIIILDVEDPFSISEIGSYNASGTNDGKVNYLVGNKLYLGRLRGNDEFIILDIKNPGVIQELGKQDVNADINGLVVRDHLAFVGTNNPNEEFKVFNISDPDNITLWSSLNFPQIITTLDYEDNIVYAGVRSNDALRIITSDNN